MSGEPFRVLVKQGAECLSALAIGKLALEPQASAPSDTESHRHLAGCSECRGRVERERREVQESLTVPLPAVVRAAALRSQEKRARPGWGQLARLFIPALALAVLVVSVTVWETESPGDTRPKGGEEVGAWSVELALLRGGKAVPMGNADTLPIALHAGDTLQLQVLPTSQAWIRLEGEEAGAWRTWFEGALPEGGWLPLGIELSPEGRSRIRLWRCATMARPPDAGCDQRVFEWAVR